MGDVNVPCTSYMIHCYAAEISGMVYYVTCCYAAVGEVYQSPHSNSHEDNPPAQLASKVKKKTKCAVCVLIDVIGKTTFSKKTCTAPQREEKKSKTTLNAH